MIKNKKAAIGQRIGRAERQPGASDAVHRSLRGGRRSAGRGGGSLERLPHILLLTTMGSDDEHKHHKHHSKDKKEDKAADEAKAATQKKESEEAKKITGEATQGLATLEKDDASLSDMLSFSKEVAG